MGEPAETEDVEVPGEPGVEAVEAVEAEEVEVEEEEVVVVVVAVAAPQEQVGLEGLVKRVTRSCRPAGGNVRQTAPTAPVESGVPVRQGGVSTVHRRPAGRCPSR